MAAKLGYLDIPEGVLIPIEQALDMPGKQVVIMCTGSQGEPSSILGRLSIGTNRQFDIKEGDTIVLSSHPIPGNEEPIYRMINRLFERGRECDLRSHRPCPCIRSRQPGRDEAALASGPAQIFHSDPWRTASIKHAFQTGTRSRHP